MKVMDTFFELIQAGKIKIRITFTKNSNTGFTYNNYGPELFFILYFHFIENAFGFSYCNPSDENIFVRLYFDELPNAFEHRKIFKELVKGLQTTRPFQLNKLKIRKEDIAEVNSKRHLLLQLLDIALGAICFRLNRKHEIIQEGKLRRGNRTIAKEKLYKHIYKKLKQIHAGFRIQTTTRTITKENQWTHSYRHILLKATELKNPTNYPNKKSSILTTSMG